MSKKYSFLQRVVTIYIILTLLLLSNGCWYKDTTSQSKSSSKTSDSISQSDPQMYNRIKKLIDNNIVCMRIFKTGTLDCENTDTQMRKVISDKFPTFNDLKVYVSDTYIKSEAHHYLYDFYEGDPIYFEKDGIFYYNSRFGEGLYETFDWDNYTFTYSDIDSTTKLVKIFLMEYSDDIQSTSKTSGEVTVKLILEDGVWKLEEMTQP